MGNGSGPRLVLDLFEAVATQASTSVGLTEPGDLLSTVFGRAVFRLADRGIVVDAFDDYRVKVGRLYEGIAMSSPPSIEHGNQRCRRGSAALISAMRSTGRERLASVAGHGTTAPTPQSCLAACLP